jgi:hypothetical protein
MAWDESCRRLRDKLMHIYTDVADARRIAMDAQLNVGKVDFSGSAENFWTSIVKVAENDKTLIHLIREVREHNSKNAELAALEQEFVRRSAQQKTALEIPRLLLYLADCDDHEIVIQDSTQTLQDHHNRLVVYIIHGNEYQSHDMFLERMQKLILPRLLTTSAHELVVKDYLLHWPHEYRDETKLRRWLLQKLSEQIDPKNFNTIETVNNALACHPGPVVIHTHVMTEDWFPSSPLTTYLRFWDAWPSVISPYPLILCFSIKYQDPAKFSWFKRYKYQQQNNRIERELDDLDTTYYVNLRVHTLPLLRDIDRGAVENWARRPELRPLCGCVGAKGGTLGVT